MIVRLDRGELPAEEVGGKAAGLSKLFALGLPVPPAVAIPADADVSRAALDPLVAQLGEPLAVRSSAIGEDAADRSAAGQYESVMGVWLAGLTDAVERVRASASSDRATAYRGETATMVVVVQREVPSSRAGVAFSRDPVDGAKTVLIECVFGHGERLVGGEANPDRYWVGAGKTPVRARMAERDGSLRVLRTLRDDEAVAVADLTRSAERGFGGPVDVEFAFEGPRLWLLQCRAITTLR